MCSDSKAGIRLTGARVGPAGGARRRRRLGSYPRERERKQELWRPSTMPPTLPVDGTREPRRRLDAPKPHSFDRDPRYLAVIVGSDDNRRKHHRVRPGRGEDQGSAHGRAAREPVAEREGRNRLNDIWSSAGPHIRRALTPGRTGERRPTACDRRILSPRSAPWRLWRPPTGIESSAGSGANRSDFSCGTGAVRRRIAPARDSSRPVGTTRDNSRGGNHGARA